MKLLVTGSSGFIGTHLTTLLARVGHEVVGLDFAPTEADFGVSRFFPGDIRKPETVKPALEGVECVIHLAAVHFDYGHADEEYWETNEGGGRALLSAMREAGIQKHVFTSTIAVYGERDDESNEETEPNPKLPYGASKLAAEVLVREWAEEDPSRAAVIVRPCAVFGVRNITNMNNLIKQIDSGFFLLFGAGTNIKSIAYVENLVEGIRVCLDRLEPGVRVFNYADKPDLTVNEIVDIICDALGRKHSPRRYPLWLGTLLARPFDLVTRLTGRNLPVSSARVKKLAQPTRIDASRLRAHGFEQPCTTEEGLRRMVAHHLAAKDR